MYPRFSPVVVMAALLLLATPSSGSAQLGGLVKKARQAIGGEAAAPAPVTAPAAASGTTELTPPVVDRLVKALQAEMDVVATAMAEEEKLSMCVAEAYMSEEALKIQERLSATIERGDYDGVEKVQKELSALWAEKCGADPFSPDFHDEQSGASIEAALAAGGFTDGEYAKLKERVRPFCTAVIEEEEGGPKADFGDAFTASEIAALRPRCGILYPLLAEL